MPEPRIHCRVVVQTRIMAGFFEYETEYSRPGAVVVHKSHEFLGSKTCVPSWRTRKEDKRKKERGERESWKGRAGNLD